MKIIEALKELPLLEKRVAKNVELIRNYASEIDFGKGEFTFGSLESQRKEVLSLVQANDDLIARRAKIRTALAVTNAKITVTINGKTRSITEWIEYRQKGLDLQVNTMNALTDQNANKVLQQNQGKLDLTAGVRVVRFYDEKERNEKIANLTDERASIDSQLEIVNATTDLVQEV